MLLAAVVGGCAGTKSTVIPLSPIAQGEPVDASSYDLMVDGQPGGRVLLEKGQARRDTDGRELIHVGMQVDNRTGDRTFRLPSDQLYLSNVGGQPVKLVTLDGASLPGSIDVPPGQSRTVDLGFVPVAPIARRDLSQVQLHWTLLIDGATEPIVRSTSFAALDRNLAVTNRSLASRNYDLPSTAPRGRIQEDDRLKLDRPAFGGSDMGKSIPTTQAPRRSGVEQPFK